MIISKRTARVGLGSFAYRYAIGFGDVQPPHPMSVLDFVDAAHRLGFEGVQLCENLDYASLGKAELLAVKERADELGLFIEVGMRDATVANLKHHLEIAELLSARLLRVVLGQNRPFPEEAPEKLVMESIENLRAVLPIAKRIGVSIGIENHFDLPSADLVRIVRALNDPGVGMILDTTNGLGFMERPEETLEALKPYLLSLHLKDYVISKVEAGYFVTGATLGAGRLNTAAVLGQAIAANPNLSLIIELTIRRQEKQALQETLRSEEQAIKDSLEYLQSLMPQFT
jgi:sugar phosphate isomerase/epimerase